MLKEIEIIGLYKELNIKIPFNGKTSLSDSEVTILIGENGSGKTTILNILNILATDVRKLLNIDFEKIILKTENKEFIIIKSELEKANSDFVLNFINALQNEKEQFLDSDIKDSKLDNYILITANLNYLFTTKFYPTYRRIEKDINIKKIQRAKNIKESNENENMFFGMDDIEKLIEDFINKLKTSSSLAFEEIKKRKENGEDIDQIFKEIEEKNSVEINILNNFMNVCNKYLFNKQFVFMPKDYAWYIEKKSKKRVTLKDLSSGEKQMVSIFAQLYLTDDKDLLILFDEPELSISVAWQKMLIPDMLKSNRIKQLIIATHSPFIFDNDELFENTVDIDDCTIESTLE